MQALQTPSSHTSLTAGSQQNQFAQVMMGVGVRLLASIETDSTALHGTAWHAIVHDHASCQDVYTANHKSPASDLQEMLQ